MFVRTFGAAEDQKNKVHGYRQRVNDDGDDGYKHFDSFHKKNGDKYGYETFSSYGIHEHGAKEGGDAHSGAESKNEECKLIIRECLQEGILIRVGILLQQGQEKILLCFLFLFQE